jgi:hypothetical protein
LVRQLIVVMIQYNIRTVIEVLFENFHDMMEDSHSTFPYSTAISSIFLLVVGRVFSCWIAPSSDY